MSGGFSQQRAQRAAQQPSEGLGNNLPIIDLIGIKTFEANHQVEGVAVNFHRVDRGAARLPCPAPPNIGGAPPAKFVSWLFHHQPTNLL
jgi:hypothetical protein